MKADLGNLSAATLNQLATAIRSRLGHTQRLPALIGGFLGHTGLTFESQPSARAFWRAAFPHRSSLR
jgi:hypothetical protein